MDGILDDAPLEVAQVQCQHASMDHTGSKSFKQSTMFTSLYQLKGAGHSMIQSKDTSKQQWVLDGIPFHLVP